MSVSDNALNVMPDLSNGASALAFAAADCRWFRSAPSSPAGRLESSLSRCSTAATLPVGLMEFGDPATGTAASIGLERVEGACDELGLVDPTCTAAAVVTTPRSAI